MEDNNGGHAGEDTAVLGVRFQEAGKIYYFEPGGYEGIQVGNYVVVETSRGVELGRVVIAPGQVLSAELSEPLKPIIRPGIPEDLDCADRLKEQAAEATALARVRARALDLPMKIVSSQYTLDGSRLTIFFTSEGRVDFRELVRDLGHHIHAQVQLRQVGPRDQAKLIGGYGRCGRRLCCTSWLTAFPGTSIKMAKEQNLPLNPSKISGQCGRLLCCLSYENDVYKSLKAQLPRPDSWVTTPAGNARVMTVNAIKQIVTLQLEDLRVVELTVAQLGLERGVVRPLPGGPGTESVDEDACEVIEETVTFGLIVEETVVRRGPAPEPAAGGAARQRTNGAPPNGRQNGRPGPQQPRPDGRPQTRLPNGAPSPAEQAPRSGARPQAPRAAAVGPAGDAAPTPDGGQQRRRRRHRGGKGR